jgi:hypothetical protein
MGCLCYNSDDRGQRQKHVTDCQRENGCGSGTVCHWTQSA